jgi:hypothetical protein
MHEELRDKMLSALCAIAHDHSITSSHEVLSSLRLHVGRSDRLLDQALIRVQFMLTSRRYLGLARDAVFEENEPRT